MKTKVLTIVCIALFLMSCGDGDLPEDYVVVSNKIIAVRINESEVSPGDTVSMKLLVAGQAMDQTSDIPVNWSIGNPDDDYHYQEVVPYNEELSIELPGIIPGGFEWIDVPVVVSIQDETRSLSSLKRFRIIDTPVGRNPRIEQITADWMIGNEHHTATLLQGDTLTVDPGVFNISFTADMAELPEGANDILIFKWYYTDSNDTQGKLEINDTKSVIENLLGTGAKASEFRQSVVVSLYGKDAEGAQQKGTYNLYLVVRDNASSSHSAFEDRLGTNFCYFSLTVM